MKVFFFLFAETDNTVAARKEIYGKLGMDPNAVVKEKVASAVDCAKEIVKATTMREKDNWFPVADRIWWTVLKNHLLS